MAVEWGGNGRLSLSVRHNTFLFLFHLIQHFVVSYFSATRLCLSVYPSVSLVEQLRVCVIDTRMNVSLLCIFFIDSKDLHTRLPTSNIIFDINMLLFEDSTARAKF